MTMNAHVIYGEASDSDEADLYDRFPVALEPAPSLAVITSQTCDIDEQGIPRRKPWVQYAPLFDASDAPRRGLYTWPLDGSGLPAGEWYADLRMEGCAEKNALIGFTPIRGFASELRADEFGRHLGRLRSRPALANHLVETVTEHLRQFRKGASNGVRRRIRREVAEARLDIADGSRMEPRAVRVVVIHGGEPSDELREWFDEWYDAARLPAGEKGIELHAVRHVNGVNLNYLEVKDLITIDLSG